MVELDYEIEEERKSYPDGGVAFGRAVCASASTGGVEVLGVVGVGAG